MFALMLSVVLTQAGGPATPPMGQESPEYKKGDAVLLWAGGLNQDSRPDVILMAGAESRHISLYLSSKGSKGPRKVATYEDSGLD